jgi:hypothetical protein
MDQPLPWWVRAYLLLGAAQAIGIGGTGLLAPAAIQIPLRVTPLNARFTAALYLAAATGVLLAALGRTRGDARLFVIAFYLATSLILMVTLLRWRDFMADGLEHRPFWLFTYIVDPVLGLGVVRAAYRAWPAGTWNRLGRLFTVQLAVLGALGVVMLVAASRVATYWPWKLPPELGQFYGCFFIAFAAGAWMAARESRPIVVRNFTLSSLVLCVLILGASAVHFDRFSQSPLTWLWFGAFGLGGIGFAWALASWQRELSTADHTLKVAI